MKIDSITAVSAIISSVYKINYFIRRAHTACPVKLLEDELSNTVKVGINHGYNPQIIYKLFEKFNSYLQCTQTTRPFYRKTSNIPTIFERLRKKFSRFGIHFVTYPTKRTCLQQLQIKLDPIPISYHSGINHLKGIGICYIDLILIPK